MFIKSLKRIEDFVSCCRKNSRRTAASLATVLIMAFCFLLYCCNIIRFSKLGLSIPPSSNGVISSNEKWSSNAESSKDASSIEPVSQEIVSSQNTSPTPLQPTPSKAGSSLSGFAEVAIPANLKLVMPDSIKLVPPEQMVVWMPFFSMFSDISQCQMFFYTNPAVAMTVEMEGYLNAVPVNASDYSKKTKAGLIIAVNHNPVDYRVEILDADCEFDGVQWLWKLVKNTTSSKMTVSRQLGIVSPRMPLTKARVNDLSGLQIFDAAIYAASGKSPFRFRPVCIDPMMNMLAQATKDGIQSITIRDTYRGYEQQSSLFQSIIRYYQRTGMNLEEARKRAESETAAPGTSEHHDGYTADVITTNTTMNQEFSLTPFGAWLAEHCWENGFVIRYPRGKEVQTTKKYEPWHVRYLGLPTALLLHHYEIVLDEFHAYLAQKQMLFFASTDTKKEVEKTIELAAETDGLENSGLYLYVRCQSLDRYIITEELSRNPKSILSETGDGTYLLMLPIG